MKRLTVTSDFGTKDGYLVGLKGTLQGVNADLQVIDLVHDVPPYDILIGSLFIRQAIRHFPKKTIHLAAMDIHYGPYGNLLVAQSEDLTIIAPNNGLISLLNLPDDTKVYLCEYVYDGFQSFLAGLGDTLYHILAEKDLNQIGSLYPGHKRRLDLQATINEGQIKATVIHIDQYENVILNIDEGTFDQHRNGRKFKIYYKRHDPIEAIQPAYGCVPIGEPLAMFNSYGLMEIAINKDKAHSLLGLNKDDAVIIEFE